MANIVDYIDSIVKEMDFAYGERDEGVWLVGRGRKVYMVGTSLVFCVWDGSAKSEKDQNVHRYSASLTTEETIRQVGGFPILWQITCGRDAVKIARYVASKLFSQATSKRISSEVIIQREERERAQWAIEDLAHAAHMRGDHAEVECLMKALANKASVSPPGV